jgi:hypothetical protein
MAAFTSAGPVLASIVSNLIRAAGAVASAFQATAAASCENATAAQAPVGLADQAILGCLWRHRRMGRAMPDALNAGRQIRSCGSISPRSLVANVWRQPGEEVYGQTRALGIGVEARCLGAPQVGDTCLNR